MYIKQILADHKLWLNDPAAGKRADLSGADLRSAKLSSADLSSAVLYGADLRSADLRRANLRSADLRRVGLYGADLSGADLSCAVLSGADLRSADLRRANLRSAKLSSADLSSADLSGATLDSPIYQFYIGKYNAVATKDYLRIGCQVHPWSSWLRNYGEIGAVAQFTQTEITNHGKVIKLFYELLTEK